MKHATTVQFLWVVFVGWALGIAGCGDHTPKTPVAISDSSSTTDQVCKITADLLNVDRSKIKSETSLGDLGADELDFVELVMELEEHFDIAIPDETAERMMGTDDWQQGMKNVTMARLASVIGDRIQMSRSGGPEPLRGTEQMQQSMSAVPDVLNTLTPHEPSQPSQVRVFLNPLVMLLAGAEKKMGRPLTCEEVLNVRDGAAFIMMSPDQARKFYGALDAQVPVHRMNPDRVWEEWQEIRGQLK